MSRLKRGQLALAGGLIVGAVAATSAVGAAIVAEEPRPEGVIRESFTIEAPALDAELGANRLVNRAGPAVDVKSSGPLIVASTVSGRVRGGEQTYTLDVLDDRSSLEEIIKVDSLKPLSESSHWAVFRDPDGSATEIVGEADGVMYSLIVSGELSEEEALALLDGLSVEDEK